MHSKVHYNVNELFKPKKLPLEANMLTYIKIGNLSTLVNNDSWGRV